MLALVNLQGNQLLHQGGYRRQRQRITHRNIDRRYRLGNGIQRGHQQAFVWQHNHRAQIGIFGIFALQIIQNATHLFCLPDVGRRGNQFNLAFDGVLRRIEFVRMTCCPR